MNHIAPSAVSQRIQYLSHRNGRRTATIRSAHQPTPCVLPSAEPNSPPTTSDPLSPQAAPPTLPHQIIPGTPDPESPSTTPPRQPTYAAVVRRQYLGILVRRRYRRRLQHRLNNPQHAIRQHEPHISPVPSPTPTTPHSDPDDTDHTNNDSDTSLEINYRANANHRPEMGESNAESAIRHEHIERDVKRMKREREQRRNNRKQRINNNVQEVQLDTDYNLYANPDQPTSQQPIPFLYDTGAALSMISSQPPWAWTNLRDCLYAIGGCFNGPTQTDLQMGEYISWNHDIRQGRNSQGYHTGGRPTSHTSRPLQPHRQYRLPDGGPQVHQRPTQTKIKI